MIENLTGRVAVVTGGASGIGLALGTRFAQAGMAVVLADVERPKLEAAVEVLTEAGHRVTGVYCDVSDADSVRGLLHATLDTHGAVHLLCNNAGVESGDRFADVPVPTWRWVMEVNFFGVVYGMREFLPHLRAQDQAHIVNTASLSAFAAGAPTFGPYVASKFAILGASENLHAELAAERSTVGISIIAPGPVRTQMSFSERNRPDGVPSTESNALRQQLIRGLMAKTEDQGLEPSEIAEMVVEAVHTDRFFVLPHRAQALEAVRKRLRWMEFDEEPGRRLAGE